jgi:hypothetical protein
VTHRWIPGAFALLLTAACGQQPPAEGAEGSDAEPPGAVSAVQVQTNAPQEVRFTADPEDWRILKETIERAWAEGLDTGPLGENIVGIARGFVGVPYTPKTLDPPGPELLVVNLREFDCVTLVESVLALTHFARTAPRDIFDDPSLAQATYRRHLAEIRYRGGTLGTYRDRLHYFSEWLSDNELRGVVQVISDDLGGVVDPESIDFMTTHSDAYVQLADPSVVEAIRGVEARLNTVPRYFIPEGAIATAASGIQDGDVIAATSTVEGLDIAHTGIAIWVDGALHLLHAPLVGSVVQISERPLADRIQGFSAQDGVMVARPLDPKTK